MRFNMSLDEVMSSKARLRILKHLINNEAPMSEGELAKVISVSHMTINRLMRDMSALNLVSMERIGNANVWTVNKESYAYKAISKAIKAISETPAPMEHLKKTILNNIPKRLVSKIILFGSVAEGKSMADSDIDLFILVKSKQETEKLSTHVDKLSNLCLKLYGNRLSPYILTRAELGEKMKLPLLREIERGIQIL